MHGVRDADAGHVEHDAVGLGRDDGDGRMVAGGGRAVHAGTGQADVLAVHTAYRPRRERAGPVQPVGHFERSGRAVVRDRLRYGCDVAPARREAGQYVRGRSPCGRTGQGGREARQPHRVHRGQ